MTEVKTVDSRTNLITREEMRRYVNAGTQADPIGTIKAWHKAGLGGISAPALTDGWVECNGQTLSDVDSMWDGEVVPDLNGDVHGTAGGRFLRGRATSGAVQNATQVGVTVETNSTTLFFDSSGANASLFNTDFETVGLTGAGGAARGFITKSGDAAVNQIRSGRVRPASFSVVWIMRIK